MHDRYPRVLGTGLVCLDIINNCNSTCHMIGGSCGNVVSALSFLGWNSTVVTSPYMDFAGEIIKLNLEKIGVKRIEFGLPISAPRIIETVNKTAGNPKHKFLFSCPECGKELPKISPVGEKDGRSISKVIDKVNVFYTDRISKGISILRDSLANDGAWTFYEPNSSRNTKALIENSLQSNIVKFASNKVPLSVSNRLRELAVNGATVLIVRTEGSEGLSVCYKTRGNKMSKWIHQRALPALDIVDTAGAGDWCTAGLIFSLVNKFPQRQNWLIKSDVINALQLGQALAAFSCTFIGAQGLLYSDSQATLEDLFSKYRVGTSLPEFKSIPYTSIKFKDDCCHTCLLPSEDMACP